MGKNSNQLDAQRGTCFAPPASKPRTQLSFSIVGIIVRREKLLDIGTSTPARPQTGSFHPMAIEQPSITRVRLPGRERKACSRQFRR
jgi:hypothetical protein